MDSECGHGTAEIGHSFGWDMGAAVILWPEDSGGRSQGTLPIDPKHHIGFDSDTQAWIDMSYPDNL